jgi:hypothetical protein
MVFLHSLDDVKYAEFKQSMKNGWALKAMKPPQTVNKIYRLAVKEEWTPERRW